MATLKFHSTLVFVTQSRKKGELGPKGESPTAFQKGYLIDLVDRFRVSGGPPHNVELVSTSIGAVTAMMNQAKMNKNIGFYIVGKGGEGDIIRQKLNAIAGRNYQLLLQFTVEAKVGSSTVFSLTLKDVFASIATPPDGVASKSRSLDVSFSLPEAMVYFSDASWAEL